MSTSKEKSQREKQLIQALKAELSDESTSVYALAKKGKQITFSDYLKQSKSAIRVGEILFELLKLRYDFDYPYVDIVSSISPIGGVASYLYNQELIKFDTMVLSSKKKSEWVEFMLHELGHKLKYQTDASYPIYGLYKDKELQRDGKPSDYIYYADDKEYHANMFAYRWTPKYLAKAKAQHNPLSYVKRGTKVTINHARAKQRFLRQQKNNKIYSDFGAKQYADSQIAIKQALENGDVVVGFLLPDGTVKTTVIDDFRKVILESVQGEKELWQLMQAHFEDKPDQTAEVTPQDVVVELVPFMEEIEKEPGKIQDVQSINKTTSVMFWRALDSAMRAYRPTDCLTSEETEFLLQAIDRGLISDTTSQVEMSYIIKNFHVGNLTQSQAGEDE